MGHPAFGAGAGKADSLTGMTDRKAKAKQGWLLWFLTIREYGEGWRSDSKG